MEQVAVGLVNNVKDGGYKLITTEELKKWIDAKKDMLIIDTMPYEDSYKKEHVPVSIVTQVESLPGRAQNIPLKKRSKGTLQWTPRFKTQSNCPCPLAHGRKTFF